jgi:hypothetical protein
MTLKKKQANRLIEHSIVGGCQLAAFFIGAQYVLKL